MMALDDPSLKPVVAQKYMLPGSAHTGVPNTAAYPSTSTAVTYTAGSVQMVNGGTPWGSMDVFGTALGPNTTVSSATTSTPSTYQSSIFDQQLGAYYFPEQRLYFDPRFNAYYAFDEATKSFVFHSQPGRGTVVTDVEGSDYELVSSADDVRRLAALRSQMQDPSANYPPAVRLILLRPGLHCNNKRGQLFIVSSCVESAFLGTSDSADIRLEFTCMSEDEASISSIHARIGYLNGEYSVQSCLMDGGGVWVDERDIGQQAMPISHDCTLRCGKDTEFLVHIHPGYTTCRRCEPSFYSVQIRNPPEAEAAVGSV